MKGSSIASVILVASLVTVAVALIVNAMLGDPNEESVDVVYMDVIQPVVSEPDPEVFNNRAVNPTVEVYVGTCKTGEVWDEEEQRCVEDVGEEQPDTGEPEE